MKKLILSIIAVGCLLLTANAQEIADNAIGLRLGGSDGFETAISYQHALGENNRLEVDLGWQNSKKRDGFKIAGLYQWVWQIDGNLNWYAGPGGGLGSYNHEINIYDDDDVVRKVEGSNTFLFVAGDIGIEYNFDFPLLLSLDVRPEIGFGDDIYDNNDLDFDIALGLRYQF